MQVSVRTVGCVHVCLEKRGDGGKVGRGLGSSKHNQGRDRDRGRERERCPSFVDTQPAHHNTQRDQCSHKSQQYTGTMPQRGVLTSELPLKAKCNVKITHTDMYKRNMQCHASSPPHTYTYIYKHTHTHTLQATMKRSELHSTSRKNFLSPKAIQNRGLACQLTRLEMFSTSIR